MFVGPEGMCFTSGFLEKCPKVGDLFVLTHVFHPKF